MTSFAQRIRALLNSPQGRRLLDHGRRELAKPANQDKLRRLLSRHKRRR